MRESSLASVPRSGWLTTAVVARMLERTPSWVRRLARQRQLACEITDSGQRLFRAAEVERFLQKRAQARRVIAVAPPQILGGDREPYQLWLIKPRLRIVGGERSVPHAEAKGPGSCEKRDGV